MGLAKEPKFLSKPFLCEVLCVSDLKHLGQFDSLHQLVFASCVHHLLLWSATHGAGEDEAEGIRHTPVVMFVLITVDDKSWLSLWKLVL